MESTVLALQFSGPYRGSPKALIWKTAHIEFIHFPLLGNTFKLSLSPDFQNISSAFTCHLRRKSGQRLHVNFTVQIGLMSQNTSGQSGDQPATAEWLSSPKSFSIQLNGSVIAQDFGPLSTVARIVAANTSSFDVDEVILRGTKIHRRNSQTGVWARDSCLFDFFQFSSVWSLSSFDQ